MTYGLGVIYNFQSDLANSWFLGANYIIQKVDYEVEALLPADEIDESGDVTNLVF
jgi:hypothetical protein